MLSLYSSFFSCFSKNCDAIVELIFHESGLRLRFFLIALLVYHSIDKVSQKYVFSGNLEVGLSVVI